MTFKTQLADDLNNVFFNTDEFAESVTYTPTDGAAKIIAAMITYGASDKDGYKGADDLGTEAVIEIQANDIYGVLQVVNGERVDIGSGTWEVVDAQLIDDGLMWQCSISRLSR